MRELVQLWRLEPRSVEEEDEHMRQWHQLSREGLEPRSVEDDDEYVRQWRHREGLEPRSVEQDDECVREGEAPREWRHGAATRSWMRY